MIMLVSLDIGFRTSFAYNALLNFGTIVVDPSVSETVFQEAEMWTRIRSLTCTLPLSMLFSCGVVMLLLAPRANPQDKAPRPKIAILVFDNIQLFDFMGPYDVLRRDNDVYLVAEKPVIETYGGAVPSIKITPQYTFANAPQPDVLVIPGGGSNKPGKSGVGRQLQNPAVIKWVKGTAGKATYILTVCNGAFIAAEAGLLDNMKATTFHTMIDDLKRAYPKVKVVDDQRFVDNGRVISTAGITSGVDGALYLNSKLHGKAASQLAALSLEYAWNPDSTFARAALADMKIPDAVYEAVEPAADLTNYSGDRNSWNSTWRLKKSDFQVVAEGVSKIMDQQKDVKRTDPKQLSWIVEAADNTHWILSLEKLGDQELAVRFQRTEQ
jgi:putative intracellular protease/amidase